MFRNQKSDNKYFWTAHAIDKMRYYRLSESRVKRVIRHPKRVEEGIAPRTVAAMQPVYDEARLPRFAGEAGLRRPDEARLRRPAGGKRYQEIWVMWQKKCKMQNAKCKMGGKNQIRIISAWIYPGKSPARQPVPKEILEEIRNLL